MSLRVLSMIGMMIIVFAVYFLSLVTIEVSFLKISLILGVLGFGIGSIFPTMSKVIANYAPILKIGSTIGTFHMIRNLGGPFGIAISATLFANKMTVYASPAIADIDIERVSIVKNIYTPFSEIGFVLFIIALIGVITASFVKVNISNDCSSYLKVNE